LLLDVGFETRGRQLGDGLDAIVINYALWDGRVDDLIGCAASMSQAVHLDREQSGDRNHGTHRDCRDHLRKADHHHL
jgi:hypothetical protein